MTKEYTITVTAPCECTNAEMDEWVEFCVGYTAQISTENPLWEFDLEVDDISLYRDWETDRKSTRLNSSHSAKSRMPSSA